MDVVPVLLGPMWMTSDLRWVLDEDCAVSFFSCGVFRIVRRGWSGFPVDDSEESIETETFKFQSASSDSIANSVLINMDDLRRQHFVSFFLEDGIIF